MAIADIDTRKLTRILRDGGAQSGCIMAGPAVDEDEALQRARGFSRVERHGPREGGDDGSGLMSGLRALATRPAASDSTRPEASLSVVALDFGVKRNILRILVDLGVVSRCCLRSRLMPRSWHMRQTGFFYPMARVILSLAVMRSTLLRLLWRTGCRCLVSVLGIKFLRWRVVR